METRPRRRGSGPRCSSLRSFFAAWPWLPLTQPPAAPTIVFYGFSILGETLMNGGSSRRSRGVGRRRGETVEFITSFAGSGTVTNQLIMGVPAAVSRCSRSRPDADRLADAGVVAPGSWRPLPHDGVVNRTPFVILVRPGTRRASATSRTCARPASASCTPIR